MKEKDQIGLGELFLTFLKISSFTFGGGYTIIPVIKNEFSEKRNLISEDDMLQIVAISQSGPGALAINGAILTGYRIKGLAGALIAALASALPSIVIITIISFFYKEFSENTYVQAALTGMSGVISAILLVTTYDLFKNAIRNNWVFSLLLMVFAFIGSFFWHLNSALIIVILALSGLIVFTFIIKEEDDDLN